MSLASWMIVLGVAVIGVFLFYRRKSNFLSKRGSKNSIGKTEGGDHKSIPRRNLDHADSEDRYRYQSPYEPHDLR